MGKCNCGHPCENYPNCIDYSDVDYFECPKCKNTCSALEGFEADNAPLCNRCPDGEYEVMEPVWNELNEEEDVSDEDIEFAQMNEQEKEEYLSTLPKNEIKDEDLPF